MWTRGLSIITSWVSFLRSVFKEMKHVCGILFLDMQSLSSQNWVHVYILHLFWIFCSLQCLRAIRVFLVFVLSNTNQLLTWIASVGWWTCFLTKELGIYKPFLSNYCFTYQRKVTWSGVWTWETVRCALPFLWKWIIWMGCNFLKDTITGLTSWWLSCS